MGEAAHWRTKLRDTEAQRDRLTDTAATLAHQTLSDMVSGSGVSAAAVLKVTDLDALMSDGGVDADKVAEAVQTARDTFGITPKPKGTHVPGVGNQPGAVPRADQFTDAFRSRRR